MPHGFTYNLQDLVTLPYFGAPATNVRKSLVQLPGEFFAVRVFERIIVRCSSLVAGSPRQGRAF